MKPLDLNQFKHKNFVFIAPTDQRISNSIAWRVRCKHCGKEQLIGSSQVKRGTHVRCIYCQIPDEINNRKVS